MAQTMLFLLDSDKEVVRIKGSVCVLITPPLSVEY